MRGWVNAAANYSDPVPAALTCALIDGGPLSNNPAAVTRNIAESGRVRDPVEPLPHLAHADSVLGDADFRASPAGVLFSPP